MLIETHCSLKRFDILDEYLEFSDVGIGVLLKNKEVISSRINEQIIKNIGLILMEEYQNETVLIRSERIEINSVNDLHKNLIKNTFLSTQIIANLSFSLWLVKDNSISPNISFSFPVPMQGEYTFWNVSDIINSNCEGEFNVSMYSKSEIVKAVTLLQKINELNSRESRILNSEIKLSNGSFSDFRNNSYSSSNRLKRALFFLFEARKTSFLPAKLMFYTSAIESIVVTGSDRVTHQVKEKVYGIITKHSPKYKISKKQITNAYESRSLYIHGASMNTNEFLKLKNQSKILDGILRELLLTFINNKDHHDVIFLSNEKFDNWCDY